jgi:hypothetical protein
MNKTEAERIAAAVNIVRPEWSVPLLMKVLGDERMIRRPYADALTALIVCASDPSTERPGRVHEKGAWWSAVTAVAPAPSTLKYVDMRDCSICGLMNVQHPIAHNDDHEFEPLHAKGAGEKPTPEQRAAIDAANVEAQLKATAEKVAKEQRVVADVDDVLARHRVDDETTEEVA